MDNTDSAVAFTEDISEMKFNEVSVSVEKKYWTIYYSVFLNLRYNDFYNDIDKRQNIN